MRIDPTRFAAGAPASVTTGAAMKIIGFAGDSGAGKTTLVEQLIAHFTRAGCRVAAVKHAHHGFDIDRPGKDSYRFRTAGAAQVLLASDARWALLGEQGEGDPAATLARHLQRLDPCDLVFVEGFRGQVDIGVIEVRRAQAARDAAAQGRGVRPPPPGRIAIACDAGTPRDDADAGLPRLDIDDVPAVARFIAHHLDLPPC